MNNQKKEQNIFWVEIDKIKNNPFQPRQEFDENKLKELAESIKQYGILQPLVVIRQEKEVPTGTTVEYELIAGERRLRASKMIGLKQVPVIIRQEPASELKLEMALVENIQREDLNPIEKARAFKELINKFSYTPLTLAKKIGKSRVFISNTMRLLNLPAEMQKALETGRILEGHARPLLMLSDQPDEQARLFNAMMTKPMSIREAEETGRRLAAHRARKKEFKLDPYTKSIEEKLKQTLGARVNIERRADGAGRISIDFFSEEELQEFLQKVIGRAPEEKPEMSPQLASRSIPLDHDRMSLDEILSEESKDDYLEKFTI